MTDTLDDKQKEVKSFKEKILEDLKRANEEKEAALAAAKAREEELKAAIIEAEKEARRREEELRLAQEAKEREAFLQQALKEAEAKEAKLRQKAEAEQARERAEREAKERQDKQDIERQVKETADKIARAQQVREEAYRKAAEKEKREQLLDELARKDLAQASDDGLTITQRAKQRLETAEALLHETQQLSVLDDKEEVARASQEDSEIVIDMDSLDSPTEPILLTQELPLLTEEDEEIVVADTSSMRKRKTNAIAMRISAILVSIIVLLTLATAFVCYRYVSSALAPVNANSTAYVQVQIPEGAGNKLIGQILEESGVIKSASVFNYYTKFKNYANFKSGYYNLQPNMSLEEIIKSLQDGGTTEPVSPALGKVRITEGFTIKQIASAITDNVKTKKTGDKTPFKSKDFLALMKNDQFIAQMVEKYPKLLGSLPAKSEVTYQLEGYLFPATYDYYEETTLEELVEQMLAATDATLEPYYNSIENQNMTVNSVLTLASLVEKEGATDEDRQMIASVFNNRLAQDMPLQSNIAILYAMGKLGSKTTLAEDAKIDTAIDSPYNVYVHTGLMPGPVDSPSLSAIKAVISPATSDNLYFVADVTTGKVYYATDYDTHQENVEKYVNSKISSSSSDEN